MMLSEREKIFKTLTRKERRLLAEYEDKHGCRLHGTVIYTVVRKNKNKSNNNHKGGVSAYRRK